MKNIVLATTLALFTSLFLIIGACKTPQETKTAVNTAVTIAQDLCSEEERQPNEPDWIALACSGVDAGSSIVHVLLPRKEWVSITARLVRRKDAGADTGTVNLGPGK